MREIDRRILRISLPVLATLAAEPLYELTDTAILGHLGPDALGGAAVAMVVLGLGQAVFIFLMFGTTASVARLVGGGREDRAVAVGVQAQWMAVVLGVAVALALWPSAPTLVGWFGAGQDAAEAATTYLTVSLPGVPAYLSVMAGVGYLRGRGDTTTPLYVALATVALNLVVEVVAIYGLGLGVGASAASTVIAKWAGALTLAALVWRDARRLGAGLAPAGAELRRLGRAAAPLFLRTASLRVAFAMATAAAARLPGRSLAGYAIAAQIWTTLAYLIDGLEVAGQALVGHSLGAADPHGARALSRRILGWAAVVGTGAGATVLALRVPIAGVFSDDPEVVAVTASSLTWVAVTQPLCAVTYALDGIMVGAGDLWFMAGAMVVATASFAPAAWAVATGATSVGWLWVALAGFMAVRGALLGSRLARARWDLQPSAAPPLRRSSAG